MPTTTGIVTKTTHSAQVLLMGAIPVTTLPLQTPSSTTATLRTLYNRAARAFLLRDIPLTQSLIESAFSILHPPDTIPDTLVDQRRKWDILRITLEITIYSSPPSKDSLPDALREKQTESPQTFLTSLHTRSLSLFSPTTTSSKANSVHLPSQVLITLVYSSLRIDCPDIGRVMIEDWLARRDVSMSSSSFDTMEDGYEKVIELYCLQILPKLEQWDYAQEFLEYESELPVASREGLKMALKSVQAEVMSSRRSIHPQSLPPPPLDSASRAYSPAPSSSSSSSSLSTTSTNTIVPSAVRGPSHHPSFSSSNVSTRSLSSDSTATPRRSSRHPVLRSRRTESPTSFPNITPSFPRSQPQAALQPTSLSTYAIIKASLAPYITTLNLSTFLFFVLFPLISLALRARHRRRRALKGLAGSNAEVARRRLQVATIEETGLLGKAWGEVVRVIFDTVKMAGSGLV